MCSHMASRGASRASRASCVRRAVRYDAAGRSGGAARRRPRSIRLQDSSDEPEVFWIVLYEFRAIIQSMCVVVALALVIFASVA